MRLLTLTTATLIALHGTIASAYPLNGTAQTGIQRLEAYLLIQEGKSKWYQLPAGARLDTDQVRLRMLSQPELQLPQPDADFTAEVVNLLGKNAEDWGLSVLDLSDPEHPVYAEHNANRPFNPGSLGKLVVAMGLFNAMAELYPEESARRQFLHDTEVVTDRFIQNDDHMVPFVNSKKRLYFRPLQLDDRNNLWSFLDWMLSPSSNAAASTVMEQMMLMHHFGRDYPITAEKAEAFWRETPRAALGGILAESLRNGLLASGLDPENLWQGKFFTNYGKRMVPGGRSTATPRELIRFLLHLEQGKVVDPFSSLAIKRLLYMTERRIRYAASPALADAALYFKSGSLYSCKKEHGFSCGKYKGNVINRLNSAVIVEWPAENPSLFYLVVVTSNELKENAAVAHQTLATRLHRLMQRRHRGGTVED